MSTDNDMEFRDSVRSLAAEIIDKNRQEVEYFCDALDITLGDITNAWVVWDTGINDYGNEIYNSHAMRVAMHLHNYIPNNWHDKRQTIVLNLLNEINPESIVEVGFGTPQRYVAEYVLKYRKSLNLLDFDEESLLFAKVFLDSKSSAWNEHTTLNKHDMNSGESIGSFDCYIFQDSVEHADNPTEYLSQLVSQAPSGAHFIFSLPIEVDRPVPEHHIFWRSEQDALDWITSSGLSVVKSEEILMNKDLDLFAKSLHPDFKEIVVHAVKP